MNTLFFGDNLSVLRERVRDESVDLVYLDPPFNSDATYNLLFDENSSPGTGAQIEAFRDTWEWGQSAEDAYEEVMRAAGDLALVMRGLRQWLGQSAMMAYLSMMAARLLHLRRALKPSGSLYLHCDPKASHYLKIILDAIFFHSGFRSEVIWKRTSAHSAARRWGDVHDSILFYTKSGVYTWNQIFTPYDENYLKRYKKADEDGRRWTDDNLTGPGIRRGDSGAAWRGFNPTAKGLHWKVSAKTVAILIGAEAASKLTTTQKLDVLDRHGMIYWPDSDGFPRFKRYLGKGLPPQDVITDIPPLNSQAKERLGYPTQKPLALLERIIAASSKEGDVVLDPFCGCGTTVEAAEKLGREWVGIDVTHYAVTLIEARLKAKHPWANYKVEGRPADLAGARELARRDKHQFQWWAAWRVGAQTYYESPKGADRGIDGNIFYKNGPYGDGRIIISVKAGENVGVDAVRDLRGVIEREEAEMGVLVTLAEPTRAMVQEALSAGVVRRSAHGKLPRIQIVTAADLLDCRLPKLPPLPLPESHPVRAPRRRDKDQLELLLPFPGERVFQDKGVVVDPRFVKLA